METSRFRVKYNRNKKRVTMQVKPKSVGSSLLVINDALSDCTRVQTNSAAHTAYFRAKTNYIEAVGTRAAWTDQRRARQAQLLRCRRPWLRSTGPRTAAGKARSARNATAFLNDPQGRDAYQQVCEFLRTGRMTPQLDLLLAVAELQACPELLSEATTSFNPEMAEFHCDDVVGRDDGDRCR